MPTAKAERLLDLVIALLNSPRFRSAPWIRDKVAGYGDAASDEAFFRMFERDKQELRDLGIPLQTVGERRRLPDPAGRASRCPPMSFTPAEAAALAHGRPALGDHGAGRRRLRRAAQDPGRGRPPEIRTTPDRRRPAGIRRPAPSQCCRPGCAPAEPAFAPLYAAVRARGRCASTTASPRDRSVETRSICSRGDWCPTAGAWYVVGTTSTATRRRTFRLSRVVGQVEAVGPAGAVQVPEGVDLLASRWAVPTTTPPSAPRCCGSGPGRAAGLRRGGELLVPAAGARRLRRGAGSRSTRSGTWPGGSPAPGPTSWSMDPPDLRDAVIGLLTGVRPTTGSGDRGVTSRAGASDAARPPPTGCCQDAGDGALHLPPARRGDRRDGGRVRGHRRAGRPPTSTC